MTQGRERTPVEANFPFGKRVVTHQQAGEGTFTAAGMAHQRDKASGRHLQIDILQHQPILAIGEGDLIEFNGAALQVTIVIAICLPRAIHQFKDAFASNHRLLQHRLLRGQLNQRLVKTAQVADKGIQYPDLNGAACGKTKLHQQSAQHQGRKQAEQRAQEKAVQPQRLHAGHIV